MDQAFSEFMEMVSAAAASVGEPYFQLPVADADSVYRERVYCYELYHQLRTIWGGFPYALGGEVDKSGHPHFKDGPYARSKPDLLVHVPGDMDENVAVVEVKPVTVSAAGIRDDLNKLRWFCEHARYHGGVLIVYGDAPGWQDRLQAALTPAMDTGRLRVLHHAQIGAAPVLIQL